ncbi:MAG: hypothetical protein MUE73_15360 [Planctomycetes bacterium]|jgi:hypothetical protein|nr:hypothetical protein [Planctomycetota bacterium]
MLLVTWRVSGKEFDVDSFVAEFALEPYVVFRAGEARSRGRGLHTESGFNHPVGRDDDDLDHALEDMRVFLRERRTVLEAIVQRGAASSLAVGFTVGDDQHFTRSVHIPPDLLREMALADVELEVSAYPCGGDEEPAPPAPPVGSAGG